MNSRQRRKLEAQQFNDKMLYDKWLLENTRNQHRSDLVEHYQKGKRAGLYRVSILGALCAMSSVSIGDYK